MRRLSCLICFLTLIATKAYSSENTFSTSALISAANTEKNTTNSNAGTSSPENSVLYSITNDDYVWKSGPASFPVGTQYVVLEGNPYMEGAYTIRIKFPPSYKLPAHFHTDVEEVTVISGMVHIAVGNKLEKKDAFHLQAGGFTVLYPNINHYIWTDKEGAIIQVHGIGPRVSMYVDKNEDPTGRLEDTLVKAKTTHQNLKLIYTSSDRPFS